MSALPALPGCGQPATVRVEIYSPGETLHGSLDGAVHVCREHEGEARAAIVAAGMAPYSIPLSGPIRCGDGYDHVAGRVLRAPDKPSGGAE